MRDLLVSDFLHHHVVQDELVLVFQNAHLEPKLHGNACFAFADPLGVGLEYGEHFLSMRDDFTLDNATLDLVNLAHRVSHEAFDLGFPDQINGISKTLLGDYSQCLADFGKVVIRHIQIRLVGLNDESLVLLNFVRGLGWLF